MRSRLFFQEIIILLATKIIFTKDLVKVTNLSQNFIVLIEILDAYWLDFAILIASILRNNKFCFRLAQKKFYLEENLSRQYLTPTAWELMI